MRSLRSAITITALLMGFNAIAELPKKEVIKYKGNEITRKILYDSSMVENPETGEMYLVVTDQKKTDLLNGKQIFSGYESTQPIGAPSQADLTNFLQTHLEDELDKIVRMQYVVRVEIVIDENGSLAYFEPKEPFEWKKNNLISEQFDIMKKKLEAVHFIPAKKKNKAVPYMIELSGHSTSR